MTPMNSFSIDELAQILWDYNNIQQPLTPADAILVLGSNDIRVAHHGAELFLKGYAPIIIFSGGFGVLTEDRFAKPEAEIFADEALHLGVPADKIYIENKSTNTGENIIFTRDLLDLKHILADSFIVVQKPYMLRRTLATFSKQWPEKSCSVSSFDISYAEYPNADIPRDLLINIMVGDTQRIKMYPAKGFQIPQDMPDEVWEAWEELVKRGFDKHLIRD